MKFFLPFLPLFHLLVSNLYPWSLRCCSRVSSCIEEQIHWQIQTFIFFPTYPCSTAFLKHQKVVYYITCSTLGFFHITTSLADFFPSDNYMVSLSLCLTIYITSSKRILKPCASLIAQMVKNLPAMPEWVNEIAQSCPTLCDPINCSPPGCSVGLIPGSGRSLGGGHGNPLQCSCLSEEPGRL